METFVEKETLIVEENGIQKEYDILFTFDCEDTFKTYIGYTDNSYNSDGKKNIHVAAINPLDPTAKLQSITDEKEMEMVYSVLQEIDAEANTN